jgi:hypothetical protein
MAELQREDSKATNDGRPGQKWPGVVVDSTASLIADWYRGRSALCSLPLITGAEHWRVWGARGRAGSR